MKKIMAFLKDEDGLELSEYAVMGGLIVVVIVAAVTYLKDAIDTAFRAIADIVSPPAAG
jgi:Flp pilus assembly pilin Flp